MNHQKNIFIQNYTRFFIVLLILSVVPQIASASAVDSTRHLSIDSILDQIFTRKKQEFVWRFNNEVPLNKKLIFTIDLDEEILAYIKGGKITMDGSFEMVDINRGKYPELDELEESIVQFERTHLDHPNIIAFDISADRIFPWLGLFDTLSNIQNTQDLINAVQSSKKQEFNEKVIKLIQYHVTKFNKYIDQYIKIYPGKSLVVFTYRAQKVLMDPKREGEMVGYIGLRAIKGYPSTDETLATTINCINHLFEKNKSAGQYNGKTFRTIYNYVKSTLQVLSGEYVCDDFWMRLNAQTPPSAIYQHMQTEDRATTSEAPLEKRLLALHILLMPSIDILEIKEDAIIKILAATNKDEYKEVLYQLESTELGIEGIWNRFHNYFGKNNLTAVFMLLSSFIASVQTEITQNQEIIYKNIDTDKLNEYLTDEGSNKILEVEGDLFQFKNLEAEFVTKNTLSFNGEEAIAYNKMINVSVAGSFRVGENVMNKGAVLTIPAIEAKLYSHLNTMEVTEKTAQIVGEAALLMVGVGSAGVLLRAGNYIRKAVVLGDLVGNTILVTTAMLNEDAINESLKKRLQIAGICLSLPMVATVFPKINRIISEVDELIEMGQILKKEEIGAELERMLSKTLPYSENKLSGELADEILAISDPLCDVACRISKYGCFAAGTPVYTDHGKKSIENITVSEKVLSYNSKTNTKEFRPVTALKTYIVSAILAIVFTTQDTLWATPNHPFWHKGQYVEASALHAGDTLETLEGDYSLIHQIIPITGERRVYNFTVAENSNYYVGNRGILVHNDCFLKRLTDSPELMAQIDALPDALKGQFIRDFYEAGEDVIKVLKERAGCVRAWEKMILSTDDGIKLLRKNPVQLQKFDDLVASNNLGLDADGILDVLNAASKKGYTWDFPENILDAVKRASDANIPGLKVGHKKFPESAESGGGYLIPAKKYQKAASGDANLSFELNGRSFDDISLDGKLIDRKFGYGNSIFEKIEEFEEVIYNATNDNRVRSLLTQAKGQLHDANGKPIRWEVSTPLGSEGIRALFNGQIGNYLLEPNFINIPFNSIEVVFK